MRMVVTSDRMPYTVTWCVWYRLGPCYTASSQKGVVPSEQNPIRTKPCLDVVGCMFFALSRFHHDEFSFWGIWFHRACVLFGGCCNYDSTSIRLQFDGATTIRRPATEAGCCAAA